MKKTGQWNNSRKVAERIFIQGTLVLQTPASFGNGDAEGTTDMPLLLDPLDGHSPLLTGASIAGALRSFLREYENGYGWQEQRERGQKSKAERLFGCLDNAFENEAGIRQKTAVESWLMVDDARGVLPKGNLFTELRDGVAIDPRTRTVEEDERGGHKFDIELLPAGTTFPLSFEFWKTAENEDLLAGLAAALKGLQDGEIGLGLRKSRGLGSCQVKAWWVWRYPMNEPDGLLGWLKHDGKNGRASGENIVSLLGVSVLEQDRRQAFTMDAHFALYSSLLIRSEEDADASDMAHLHSWRDASQSKQPVLPGTSLAGALRSRALRIANTMLGREKGRLLVDDLFGRRIRSHTDQSSSSQVVVSETVVENVAAELGAEQGQVGPFYRRGLSAGIVYPAALVGARRRAAGAHPPGAASPTAQQPGGF